MYLVFFNNRCFLREVEKFLFQRGGKTIWINWVKFLANLREIVSQSFCRFFRSEVVFNMSWDVEIFISRRVVSYFFYSFICTPALSLRDFRYNLVFVLVRSFYKSFIKLFLYFQIFW